MKTKNAPKGLKCKINRTFFFLKTQVPKRGGGGGQTFGNNSQKSLSFFGCLPKLKLFATITSLSTKSPTMFTIVHFLVLHLTAVFLADVAHTCVAKHQHQQSTSSFHSLYQLFYSIQTNWRHKISVFPLLQLQKTFKAKRVSRL